MKLVDVEVGVEYEVIPAGSSVPFRGRVVEVRVHREIFEGWRWRRSDRADGVRVVRVLDGEDVDEWVVRAAELRRPWAERQAADDAQAERKRKAERRASVARARVSTLGDRVDRLLGDDSGVDVGYGSRARSRTGGTFNDSPYSIDEPVVRDLRLYLGSVDQLARLVEMAEAGARCRALHHDPVDDPGETV